MQSYMPESVPTYKVVADEEFLPFSSNLFNLVTSSCSMHWVNNLPQAFNEVINETIPFIICLYRYLEFYSRMVVLSVQCFLGTHYLNYDVHYSWPSKK